MRISLFITFLSITLISGCVPASDSSGFDEAVGTVAPEFMYTSLDGQEIALSDLRGKLVYIFFYGAGCPHCRSNGSVTESINQQFTSNSNFVALGLDTWNNSVSQNISFQNSTGITYSLLLNARPSLIDYYGSSGAYDRSVVIGADGLIAYKGSGFVNTDFDQVVAVIRDELNNID